jgi:hypothetical protein
MWISISWIRIIITAPSGQIRSAWECHSWIGLDFFILILNILKDLNVLSRFILFIESFLPTGWRTFMWWKNLPKCCTILVWIAGCWNSSNILLMSRPSKNNCWFLHIFGARFGGKDCGLCPYNPSAEEVGGFLYESGSELWKLFNIFLPPEY